MAQPPVGALDPYGQSANPKIETTSAALLSPLLGGGSGGLIGSILDALGLGSTPDVVGVDIDLDGVIDAHVGVDESGDLVQADLNLLGVLPELVGLDIDADGVVDAVTSLSIGGGGGTGEGGTGGGGTGGGGGASEVLQIDIGLLGGLLDGGGWKGGPLGVDVDLDHVIDGQVLVGADGTLLQSDLDLLGGLANPGLIGVDVNLDGVFDTTLAIGAPSDGPGDDGDGSGDGSGGDGSGGDGSGGDGSGGDGSGGDGSGGDGSGGDGSGGDGSGGDGSGDGGVVVPPAGTLGFDLFKAYAEITRVDPTSADAPPQEVNLLAAIANSTQAGLISLDEAIHKIAGFADDTTTVALMTYQFFTGAIPSEAGIDYLVNAPDTVNASDLNDAYFDQFNLGNRYINFAANLAIGGEGQAFFTQQYGGLSFEAAVEKAYGAIVGFDAAHAAGIDTDAAIADIVSRQAYFHEVAVERIGGDIAMAAKAGMIGYVLAAAVAADVGELAHGADQFLFDLADGDARFAVDLTDIYGADSQVTLVGQDAGHPHFETVLS